MRRPLVKYKTGDHTAIITKLTALWALSESGLGGILHAIKLPFSGLFLASFAVVIVTYIGQLSEHKWRSITQATLIVIFIKAAASPHSPITAYIAVGFQGILGATLYSTIGVHKWSSVLYGILALIESGIQKLLVLTILFGTSLWDAFQVFSDSVGKQLKLADGTVSWIIVILYLSIYAIFGITSGIWAINIHYKLARRAQEIGSEVHLKRKEIEASGKSRKSSRIPWLWIGVLILIISSLWISGGSDRIWYVLLRTILGILFFLYVFQPLAIYFFRKWISHKAEGMEEEINQVRSFLPTLRDNLNVAYALLPEQASRWRKMRTFFINWLAVSLYLEHE